LKLENNDLNVETKLDINKYKSINDEKQTLHNKANKFQNEMKEYNH
jgi:hypothetical protein